MSKTPPVRASDAERERAVERLRAASTEGRLTLEEFSERVTAAYEARTHDQLARLTHDLPAEPGSAGVVASRRRPTRILFSLFGSTEREGRIRVRGLVLCLTVFGNIDLDLRGATLEGDVITIIAIGALGAIDVYVPEGVEADVRGLAIFGHARARGDDPPPRPGTPLVRVYALSLWAGIDVWRVSVGWAERTLRQVIGAIRKAERKQLER